MPRNSAIKITVTGVDAVIKRVGDPTTLISRLEEATDYVALRSINKAQERAPYLHGILRGSIAVLRRETMVREIGAQVDYARRQEYEHATRAGYMRRTAWEARTEYRNEVRKVIRTMGR